MRGVITAEVIITNNSAQRLIIGLSLFRYYLYFYFIVFFCASPLKVLVIDAVGDE